MAIVNDETKRDLKGIFSKQLGGNVKIWLFTSKNREACQYCDAVEEIADALAGVDARISVFKYRIEESSNEAKALGIENVPAMLIHGAKAHGIYYYGIPAGYEFESLVQDIIDVSNEASRLPERVKEEAKRINKKVDIKVFVTPTCPYCPRAVRIAHQLALENSRISASMIEAAEFEELSAKYGVMAVPKVVINGTVSFEGALPEEQFISYIHKALA